MSAVTVVKESVMFASDHLAGEPEELSVFAPVIYDEVGINLCRTITIPQNILTQYPTTSYVQLLVANIKIYSGKGFLTGEEENVEYTEEEQQEMGNPPVFSTVTTIPEEQIA